MTKTRKLRREEFLLEQRQGRDRAEHFRPENDAGSVPLNSGRLADI